VGSAESPITIRATAPAVALETAVLVGGLPPDRRAEAARRMIAAVEAEGANPAFVGIVGGEPIVGLNEEELERLADEGIKVSTRDLAAAVARGATGGTTVAATLFLAGRAGFHVAATGGIGGVHPRPGPADLSADLVELARTRVVLVCAGPKAFMDMSATFEALETLEVAVVGLGTDRVPAFWTAEGGHGRIARVEDPTEVVRIWRAARELGTPGGLLVCVPPTSRAALTRAESEEAVGRALTDLEAAGIVGPDVTPFLLRRIAEHTGGRSLEANLALLERNAGAAAAIARALADAGQVGTQ
jgi:pseudouridine-5'-phosphate glycosidase